MAYQYNGESENDRGLTRTSDLSSVNDWYKSWENQNLEKEEDLSNFAYQPLAPAQQYITIRFQVHYQTYVGQCLKIGGSHAAVGQWDVYRAVPMTWTEGNIWVAEVDFPAGAVVFYKYLLEEGDSLKWQQGANHVLALPTEDHHVPNRVYEASDMWNGQPTASSSAWQELLVRRIEESDTQRKEAEQEAVQSRRMAQAALSELIAAREDAAAAWSLLQEKGWLPEPSDDNRDIDW
ncbi:hypothetical protein CYMTET_17383 [Cymbomonas tetramitiformis]|uniref:CBM20 domain-containing protein n=1 Tax=Cymbomonas tetramitiformis TaxID=36881 RepID=A0AAE0GBM6_9CHLO|nr:hypothetical protein CYMTET_17383 [Cymbomonas tetramitiformis]